MKTIKILKIIRDDSSQPNHNIPYTKKMCVIKTFLYKLKTRLLQMSWRSAWSMEAIGTFAATLHIDTDNGALGLTSLKSF